MHYDHVLALLLAAKGVVVLRVQEQGLATVIQLKLLKSGQRPHHCGRLVVERFGGRLQRRRLVHDDALQAAVGLV
eukprot:2717770-Pleurochrysis_carterae.AAC.1